MKITSCREKMNFLMTEKSFYYWIDRIIILHQSSQENDVSYNSTKYSKVNGEKQSKHSDQYTPKCIANHASTHKMYCLLYLDFVIKHANDNHIIVDSHQLLNFFINLSDQADLIYQKVDLVNCRGICRQLDQKST
jgi:hypothetical protein